MNAYPCTCCGEEVDIGAAECSRCQAEVEYGAPALYYQLACIGAVLVGEWTMSMVDGDGGRYAAMASSAIFLAGAATLLARAFANRVVFSPGDCPRRAPSPDL